MKQLILLALVLIAGCAKKPESKLTIYTALESEQYPVYLESFEKAHPEINVEVVRNSTGVITAKLLAEKDNPQADLVWGTAATSLMILKQAGILEPYKPAGVERVNPLFRDQDSVPTWVGIDAFMTAFACNTVELKRLNLPEPKSYDDLLNPAYKGKIILPNPASSGTGYFFVSAILQLKGDSLGWDYLTKLHENVAVYSHSGSKPAKLAGAGEYPIGISFCYPALTQKLKGDPVSVVFPAEGSGWDMEANGLIKKAQIKPEAKLFLDWAISNEAITAVSKNFGIVTVDVGAKPIEGYPAEPLKQLVKNDFAWASMQRDSILAQWSKRFDGKSEEK